jgi:predicted phosphodiesterase
MTVRHVPSVAVLSDIHANLPALNAVLAEPDVAAADAVVLLGDIALGPMPAETLDVLAGLGERAVWVHGNCEREMVTVFDGGDVPGPNGASAAASVALIGRPHRDMLDGLPLTVTLDVDGLGQTLFCHASPRRDEEMLLVDSPPDRWEAAWSGLDPGVGVVVCGHTHMQFDRLAAGRRVINPGSVGMPYGPPGAHWALLGPDVVLRRTEYDTAAAAEVIAASRYADGAEWADEYVLRHYSDAEALAAFTEIARQQEGPALPCASAVASGTGCGLLLGRGRQVGDDLRVQPAERAVHQAARHGPIPVRGPADAGPVGGGGQGDLGPVVADRDALEHGVGQTSALLELQDPLERERVAQSVAARGLQPVHGALAVRRGNARAAVLGFPPRPPLRIFRGVADQCPHDLGCRLGGVLGFDMELVHPSLLLTVPNGT